jgi:hypothetical protein
MVNGYSEFCKFNCIHKKESYFKKFSVIRKEMWSDPEYRKVIKDDFINLLDRGFVHNPIKI